MMTIVPGERFFCTVNEMRDENVNYTVVDGST